MTLFVCAGCGTQFAPTDAPPPACPICDDERQYVGPLGQRWTTLEALRTTHANVWRVLEPDLFAFATVPAFAIGQRALLLRHPQGNILWDCVTLLDDATEAIVRALGGVAAIAISHPHYYASMVEWAHAFNCQVWLHEADRAEVMRPDPRQRFWAGATLPLAAGITLINAGGHFAGGTVLHWASGAAGSGALLSGDILQVTPDRRGVSFMWSYPNLIPLPARTVRAVAATVAPYPFERVYGAFWDREILADGHAAVRRSAERTIARLGPDGA